ncbi:MAG TPA: hypothetical protein VJA00_01085 [Candidatus Omnitrophota bacterium]|nr:hypothetical protein [Candidatus Omnitrophota bacterium]
MPMKKRRLLSFLVNKPPQRYFVMMQFFMFAGVMLFLLYGSFQAFDQFSLSSAGQDLTPEQLKLQLKEFYAALFLRLLLIFLIGFFVNVLMGMIFLHRITGPLVRVRNVLNSLIEGKTPEGAVKFRHGDFTPELADALNRLVAAVKQGRLVIKK